MSPPKIQGSQPLTTPKPVDVPRPPAEVGAAKAVKELSAAHPGPGSISGKDLAAVISKAAKDPGATGKEYATIKKFVETNGKQLSPEAKKVFEVYKKHVELAQANRQPGIDFRSAGKMERELAAASRPAVAADPNATIPQTEETPEVEGYGKANGKADLGDKLKYGNTYQGADTKDQYSLKDSDLDPKVGNYIVDGKNVTSSPLKITSGQLDANLKKKFPGGVTFKPPFKDPDSKEAVLAKNALFQTSFGSAEKGAENDLIVNMGVKGSPKPTLMTTRTTKAGAVTAEIVGTTLPATKANFKSMDEAREAFKKFGMKIADAPTTTAGKQKDPSLKDWSLEELNKMHDGLNQMSTTEKKALEGVTLERRTVVPGHSTWVAEFEPKIDHPAGKEPVRNDKMIIADGAFAGDKGAFVGDASNPTFPSVRTVLHEAGHAVENKTQRDASIATEQAKFRYNEAVVPHGKLVKSWAGAYGKLKGADKDAAKQFNADLKDLDTKRAALADSPPDKVSENNQKVIDAQNKLTADFNALPASHPLKKDAGALRDSSANLSLSYAKNLADSGKKLSESQKKEGTENISTRQAKFDKYIKDNANIPEITDYAVSGSRHENFAEAYSLYKTDPKWMEANSPLLFKYFADKKHLED